MYTLFIDTHDKDVLIILYKDGKIISKEDVFSSNQHSEITLPLIKASYVDGIVSLRYENNTSNLIDSIYLVSSFTENLINDGYEFTYSDNYKKIYKNNKYKIIIKSSLDYLIILIMEN